MKKIIVLALLILSVTVVCPLPIDMNQVFSPFLSYLFGGNNNSLSNYYSQINIGLISLSGINILFYTIILATLIHYFKEQVAKESYLITFVISYVLILILMLNFPQMMLSFTNINSVKIFFFLIFLVLMTLVTLTFVYLIIDCFEIRYKWEIIITTIVVYLIQGITLIGSYLYHGNSIQSLNTNYYHFQQGINLISIIVITVLKIFVILEIMNQMVYTKEEESEILK